MKIKQFYRPEIFKARVEDSLLEAAAHMDDHQVGALAVFEGDSLIGMISERDLVRAMAQESHAVHGRRTPAASRGRARAARSCKPQVASRREVSLAVSEHRVWRGSVGRLLKGDHLVRPLDPFGELIETRSASLGDEHLLRETACLHARAAGPYISAFGKD